MKFYSLSILLLCIFATSLANKAEALCARCVEANEYHKNNPNPYFYYEDYLDAHTENK